MDYIPESPYERMQPMRDSFELRLNTFSNWPQNSPVKSLDLVRDYFYYIGIDDKCQCTYCGGVLGGWMIGDARFVSGCLWLACFHPSISTRWRSFRILISCILISKVKVLNIITLVYRLRGHYWLWVLVALLNKWTVWEMFSVFTVDYISYHPTP
jgi:hypothetical protein